MRFSCVTIAANRPQSVTTHVIGISASSMKQVKLIPAQQGGALKYCVLILKCEGADQETPAIEKVFITVPRRRGHACHPPGPRREAPETERRRWSEGEMGAFTVVSTRRNGQERVSRHGIGWINDFSGFWGGGGVPSCHVLGPSVTRAGGSWPRLWTPIKEGVRCGLWVDWFVFDKCTPGRGFLLRSWGRVGGSEGGGGGTMQVTQAYYRVI